MRARHASFLENLRSLLRYCLVIPTLAALGCASAPDLLPIGAPEFAKRPFVRRAVGYTDFPIVVSSMKDDKKVQIVWTYNGAWLGTWYWWSFEKGPFAIATRVKFTLSEPGAKTPLCSSGYIENTGKESQTYDCEFDVEKYFGQPLVGELTYWFGDKTEEDSSSPGLMCRTYYLIEQPKPKPAMKQHKLDN